MVDPRSGIRGRAWDNNEEEMLVGVGVFELIKREEGEKMGISGSSGSKQDEEEDGDYEYKVQFVTSTTTTTHLHPCHGANTCAFAAILANQGCSRGGGVGDCLITR